MNINEAARRLNVSTRTIRRHIKSGKIKAELIKGSFGDEYRILELPEQFDPNQPLDNDDTAEEREVALDTATPTTAFPTLELIRELQEKNLALAAQLGAAAERIRGLESQVKLLAPPKGSMPEASSGLRAPWWQRLSGLFRRRPGAS